MKKVYVILFILALSLSLAACGNGKKAEKQVIEEETNTPNTTTGPVETATTNGNVNETNTISQEDMQKKMDELDYAEFELEVEYANYQEYEAELERESNNSIKSKIEDSLNNVRKNGSDAFNELYPIVKQLTITQQTSKDKAIQEILDAFHLPADYLKFELDITFKDGTQLEFKDRK